MKKFLLIAVTICSLFLITNVKAATREELLQYYPEEYLNTISSERYKKLLTLDVSKAQSKTIEIKDDKYNNAANPLGQYLETTAKTLTISAIPYSGTIDYAVSLNATWKKMPVRRSYDVIAIRLGSNTAMRDKSATGAQLYTGGSVAYSFKGTNMVYDSSKGFGISMNLVNDVISSLKCFVEVDIAVGATSTIYGAYEHAVDDVSLSQSQDYRISAVGMGGVINFSDSVWPHYDYMDGVDLTITR